MSATERRTLSVLLVLALASCGGGSESPSPDTATKPEAWSASGPSSRVAIRLDWDHDGNLDVLTLDTASNPLRIVDALRGTPDGGAELATDAWHGQVLDDALNEALQTYLTRSLAVGTATELDVLVGGVSTTVTVIE